MTPSVFGGGLAQDLGMGMMALIKYTIASEVARRHPGTTFEAAMAAVDANWPPGDTKLPETTEAWLGEFMLITELAVRDVQ